MQQGEVVTLKSGSRNNWQERADWTPIAQPPGRDEVIAHTPDPSAYHNAAGRTMIPRAKQGKGNFASQGFSTKPGVINIDPTNPVTGQGGMTIDLKETGAKELAMATKAGQGDPYASWMAVNQMKQAKATQVEPMQEPPREAPPMPGYVVPASAPGGQQQVVPQAQAPADTAQSMTPVGPPLASPAVQPPPGRPAAPPAPAMQPAAENSWQPPPQQPWQQPVQPPPPAPPAYSYPTPDLDEIGRRWAQMYLPQDLLTPQAPDPTQQALLETLKEMTGTLAEIKNDLNKDPGVLVKESVDGRFNVTARPEPEVPHHEPVDTSEIAVPEDTGLHYLTAVPSPPRVQVVFDLGKGGSHLKRFHAVAMLGKCLSLVYDTRYEGDQFTPAATAEGDDPITIKFPQKNNKCLQAIVPQKFNQRLGCLDVLNFVIVDNESADISELAGDL